VRVNVAKAAWRLRLYAGVHTVDAMIYNLPGG